MITHKGIRIFRSKLTVPPGLWVWEDPIYGAESDDAFDNIQAAQDDIDRFYGDGPAPRIVNGEVMP